MVRDKLVYVTTIFPGEYSEVATMLLIDSIRTFTKGMSTTPIWCLKPANSKLISAHTEKTLNSFDVKLIDYEIGEFGDFFFVPKVYAGEKAEYMAFENFKFLVWLDSNTIMLDEPQHFILGNNKIIGYRPVHHTNIGSVYGQPLDQFWTQVYKYCGVPEDRVFPMHTHVDGATIRPYFNAGLLVTKPENYLFREWLRTLLGACNMPYFKELVNREEKYFIFLHQAILSGLVLAKYRKQDLQELPWGYNYPVHLFYDDVRQRSPDTLQGLVSFRHEGFYKDPDWYEKLPVKKQLKDWLAERLRNYQNQY